MGYWSQDGRWADTQEFALFNGTASENGSSEAVELADRGTVRLSLDVTEATAGGGDNEIQKIEFTGIKDDEGTFRVSADGGETFSEPIEVGPTMATDLQAALDDLLGAGNASVSASNEPGETALLVEFTGDLAGKDVPLLVVDDSQLVPAPGQNEIQTVELQDATGGTFTLSFQDDETDPIAYDASAEAVQSALEALDGIGEGNVEVSLAEGVYSVEFVGELAETDVPELVSDASSLTGDGIEASITVNTEQEGQSAGTPDVAVTVTQEPAPGPWALDVEVETSHDGQSWQSLGQFTQASDLGSERKILVGCDRFVRASYELTGTAPKVTFRVSGEAV